MVARMTDYWRMCFLQLGDPERKVASNASYLLSSLLTAHPVMKVVLIKI